MKVVNFLVGIFAVLSVVYLRACDTVEYRKAKPEDAAGIVELINTHGVHDNTKIVIVPELFRLAAVQASIAAGKYYVAYDKAKNKIVGFKKLYLLDNPDEMHNVANQELRYEGQHAELVDGALFEYQHDPEIINGTKRMSGDGLPTIDKDQTLCLYTGGDFTTPELGYRGTRINTKLTQEAYKDPALQGLIKKRLDKTATIACVYGLTHLNDYADDGSGASRTPGIARLFAQFVCALVNTQKLIHIYHKRFRSFMPTFDPKAIECKPLADEHAVAGYGNMLYYNLTCGDQQSSSVQ
jgi:hypothetical protein